jgi:hypothetical protein
MREIRGWLSYTQKTMRATPHDDRHPPLARLGGLAAVVGSALAAALTLPAAYLLLGLTMDGRIAAASVVAGVSAGLLAQRRLGRGSSPTT